jgi:hypothetical protein
MASTDRGERSQPKLDEAQREVDAGRRQDPVEDGDERDRPVPQPESDAATPPHGDPLAD